LSPPFLYTLELGLGSFYEGLSWGGNDPAFGENVLLRIRREKK
jgi:hypothetical protein